MYISTVKGNIKMLKIKKLLPCAMLCLCLTGCVGTEPNNFAYVTAIGFDKGSSDTYEITVQYANTANISGGEEGGSTENIVENISVQAPNLYSGINVANHIVSKRFSLSHAKLIVFSEEVAKEGLNDMLSTLAMNEEIRPNINFAVSRGKAKEYIDAVEPSIEINPVKYYQMLFEDNSECGIPLDTSKDFIFYRNLGDHDAVLPLAGVISEEQKEPKDEKAPLNEEDFEYKVKDYVAGQVGVKDKNKSEVMGMAIFKDNKFIAEAGSIETVLFNILSGRFTDGYLSFYISETPKAPLSVRMRMNKRPRIRTDIENKRIDVELFMESDLYSLPDKGQILDNIEQIQNEIKNDLEYAANRFVKKMQKDYKADVVGFGCYAKREFLTNRAFEEYKWNEKYPDFDVNVNAEFKIRRTGLVSNIK